MQQSRLTRLLKFPEPTVLQNYRAQVSENFLKRKYIQIFWIFLLWIISILHFAVDLSSSETEEKKQPLSIANIGFTSIFSLITIAALSRYKKANTRACTLIECLLLSLVMVSAAFTTYRISAYQNVKDRLVMSLASIFFLQTYSFATTSKINSTSFRIVHGIYIIIFNVDQFDNESGSITQLVFILIVVSTILMMCVLAYSTEQFDRIQYLNNYDRIEQNKIWKQIVDSLPQGAAIIQQKENCFETARIRIDNPAFKEIFGTADGPQTIKLLDDALKNVYHRDDTNNKAFEKTSSQLEPALFQVCFVK